jgi:hypothetical protein
MIIESEKWSNAVLGQDRMRDREEFLEVWSCREGYEEE